MHASTGLRGYLVVVVVLLCQLLLCCGHSPSGNHHGNTVHSSHADGKVDIDAEHIKEHLDGVADLPDNMTQEELEFHYFKLHDMDNNTRLDGIEIYNALTHYMPYDRVEKEEKMPINTVGMTPAQIARAEKDAQERYYSNIVDEVLAQDDADHDGYVTYLEFVLAKRREEVNARQAEQHQGSYDRL